MNSAKRRSANVLLQPVRLAIVQQLEIGMRQLSVGQLATELPEISPATLYRHVNVLVESGICVVVGRRKVRSVEERVYALRSPESTHAQVDDATHGAASPEQFDAVAMFLTALNRDLEASKRSRRQRARRPTYISTVAHLTDADHAEIKRIHAWILALRSRPVPPDASLRLVTFMDFPFARPIASAGAAENVRKRK
jgi:hypothetical protein